MLLSKLGYNESLNCFYIETVSDIQIHKDSFALLSLKKKKKKERKSVYLGHWQGGKLGHKICAVEDKVICDI